MNRATPELTDMRHTKVCYSKERYCGQTSQHVIRNFGDGEIVVQHSHAPCTYADQLSVTHGEYGKRTGVFLLQRSLDHGETWDREQDVVVWDNTMSDREKQAIYSRADEPGVVREEIDLTSPDSVVFFKRSPLVEGEDLASWSRATPFGGRPIYAAYAFRSADRGRNWEEVPTRVQPPPPFKSLLVDAMPPIVFPDGTLAVSGSTGAHDGDVSTLYGSDDKGLTWDYMAEIARDPDDDVGRITYDRLLLLPSGRLQCYMLHLTGRRDNVIVMAYSDDGGYTWSRPESIVRWGHSPWASLSRQYAWSGARQHGVRYRSPWPLQLSDGRIVVIFGRRRAPFGMGLIVSEDDGDTWSTEGVIRADASDWDLGYPMATQLDDGRIFTAYYFMEDDGNNFGGTRHIAGSFFNIT